mmetsp:Transcript_151322/g.367577  ORF Transcript_151322/g.367577 Transcript_151322/m.367577 type:complete len:739 (+) Transcript_151322:84-2300(+)
MQLTVHFPVLLLLAASTPSLAMRGMQGAEAQALANPIRKVVNMLQAMTKKVTEEGEKEKELYEKFMCYCKHGGGDLEASISAAETKVPAVSSNIEASEQKLEQSKGDLKQGQSDRSTAKTTMAEATAIREKEAASFAAEKAEYDDTISAITQAVAALEKGMAGSFLQTRAAQVLKQLALGKQDLLDTDRQELMSFLSASQGSDYAPQSGQITGILKEMGDTAAKSLADMIATEQADIKTHEELMAAKTKEVAALTSSIESSMNRIGDLGVTVVQMKEDLSDTQAALNEDQKFLAELDKSCQTKTGEWEERSKTRADELVALAETIKVLNDDDALELFKKTLPSAASASFLQMGVDLKEVRTRALTTLQEAHGAADRSRKPGLELLMLALSGKRATSKGTFDKVIKMVDDMVEVLKQEQTDDDHKKEYCITQLDLGDDKKKSLERTVADEENAIAAAEDGIKSLADEISAFEAGIKALDKQVAEATEQRKNEHSEFQELMATTSAAKELLGFAKNRLNKFYNPKLYVAPPKQELSEQDRIVVNMGGTPPPTPAPGGIAGTGVTVLAEVSEHRRQRLAVEAAAPPPPPETWDAYAKKSQESTGVVAMIDLLIKDLTKELTESETSEKDAQADYEKAMQDSAEKRTMDSKSLSDKLSAKADLEASLENHKGAKSAAGKELMATMKYIQSLHAECDWLMQYFDVRKEARADEVESLKNAKAILSGADLSLLQERSRVLRGAQ